LLLLLLATAEEGGVQAVRAPPPPQEPPHRKEDDDDLIALLLFLNFQSRVGTIFLHLLFGGFSTTKHSAKMKESELRLILHDNCPTTRTLFFFGHCNLFDSRKGF